MPGLGGFLTSSIDFMSFQCQWSKCESIFVDSKNLHDHLLHRHVNQTECEWAGCLYSCKRIPQLTSHILIHVPYYPYKCEKCGKSFKRKYDRCKYKVNLAKHITSMHKNDKSESSYSYSDGRSSRKSSVEYILN